MQRTAVASTHLASVGYDSSPKILEIEFKGGSVYQYFNVPYSVHQALMGARSKGGYFAQSIKPRYQCRQVA